MPRVLKHLFVILVFVVIAGCGSGGCGSGCASCGVAPLPDGFDPAARIENGAAVRLTDSGLAFLQSNLGPLATKLIGANAQMGVLTFAIPTSGGSQLGIDYTVCPNGPDPAANPPTCTAEVDIGNAKLTMTTGGPHELHIVGPLPIRLQDLPIDFKYFGFLSDSTDAVLNGNGDCPGGSETFADINIDVDISIEVDQNMQQSGFGYSKVKVVTLNIDQNQLKAGLKFCGGATGAILNGLKGIVFGQLIGPLLNTLTSQIDQQLCRKANPMLNPTCPSGTNDVSGVCRYGTMATDECAAILLGTDGHMNLGQLLATLSPGTKGGLDFVLASGGPSKRDDASGFSWGDLNPIAGGATLGMYGGAEPMPVSGCVPMSQIKLPTGIPIPDELLANSVPDWPMAVPGPHVGLALSERYANYALNSVYNSGLLCLGIGTDQVALLNTGTLGLLANSMKDLGIQRESQQVALVVRPQLPPTVTFGNGTNIDTDPVMRVKMPNAAFDFYFWSLDRYIRFMTATFDLDIPVNLTVGPDGISPVINKIGVNNPKVSNNALLKENPDTVAKSLGSLIASQVGAAVGGGIKPINLNTSLASLGLTMIIPDSVDGKGSPGLRKLTKGSDNYLGIFAALGVAGAPITKQSKSAVLSMKKFVDPAGLKLETATDRNAPVFTIKMESNLDGPEAVEFAYRTDQGFWHPWTRERIIDVSDAWFRVQGHHSISVRSRVVGEPDSIDPEPATLDVVVDAEPPHITVGEVGGENLVKISVTDLVSKPDAALVRFRLDDGKWSEWVPAAELEAVDVGEASDIVVEARDEEGNVASTEQALIRGRAAVSAAAGCGCSVPGQAPTPVRGLTLLGVALLGALVRFGRRASPPKSAPKSTFARRLAARPLLGGLAVVAAAGCFAGCSCGSDSTSAGTGDQYACAAPACAPLTPGLIGAYTSVAVSGSDIWFSGYAEADWEDSFTWGDLVVGKWNGKSVDWVAVDGVPADPAPDGKQYDLNGFRKGQTEKGDDVGLWTSLAIDAAGHPVVAYYDRTHKALKLAQSDGTTWTATTVQQKPSSDIGKYAKLLLINGNPVIAYLAIEGKAAGVSTAVRVATAGKATPGASDWTFEDVAVNANSPCRDQYCTSGTKCLQTTLACTPTVAGCTPACASGTACIAGMPAPSCVKIFDKTRLDSYPDAIGDYITIAADSKGGFGIAFYDRMNGNLVTATKSGGKWTSTIVDGADGMGNDTGDMGIGASLAIDDKGDWHLSYVDGLNEQVRYLRISGGKPAAPSVVDDGLGLGGTKFPDGQHIVGDDSHIVVTPAGEIHITYQDATVGTLHYAVGTPAPAGATKWTVKEIAHEGFGGAFSNQVTLDGQLKLVEWWRVGAAHPHGDVDLVSP